MQRLDSEQVTARRRCLRFYRRDRPGHHGAKQAADLDCDHQLGRPRTPRVGCCAVRPDLVDRFDPERPVGRLDCVLWDYPVPECAVVDLHASEPASVLRIASDLAMCSRSPLRQPQRAPPLCGVLPQPASARRRVRDARVRGADREDGPLLVASRSARRPRGRCCPRIAAPIGLTSSCLEGEPADDANAAHLPPPVLRRASPEPAQPGVFFVRSREVKKRRLLGTGSVADSSRRALE